MNRFQKILNEAFKRERFDKALDIYKKVHEYYESRGYEINEGNYKRLAQYEETHTFIIKPLSQKSEIDWDPQSNQLLDDGDEWEEDEDCWVQISVYWGAVYGWSKKSIRIKEIRTFLEIIDDINGKIIFIDEEIENIDDAIVIKSIDELLSSHAQREGRYF